MPLDAKVWRLWKVDGDTAYPTQQINDSMGFKVPGSGLWVVEAWKDSLQAGTLQGLAKTKSPANIDGCAKNLTYLFHQDINLVGVQPCIELVAPSQGSRPEKPVGIGVFGSSTAVQRVVRIPGTVFGRGAYQFVVWKIRGDSILPGGINEGVTSEDSVVLNYGETRLSPIRGTVDLSVPAGNWLFEGWSVGPKTMDFATWQSSIPRRRLAGRRELDSCLIKTDGACRGQPTHQMDMSYAAEVYFTVKQP